MNIGVWLRNLGFERYEAAFRANEVTAANLTKLTADDLKEIGVTAVAHRRVLLEAIIALRDASTIGVEPHRSEAVEVFGGLPFAEQESAQAERRQITVMFCDLVGSTALSGRLDPEDLRGIISTYHRCCTELIERNDGFVAKYMGDGLLCYFGYPKAHEHDAERAVQTGLALVEAVPKLTTAAGVPLQVRVGIATGLVVVGDLVGAGAAREQAVVGETPNLAARLQALAEPGAVVISSSTRRLTGGLFEYRDLGAVALKGFAENVPAWQALRASGAESRFEALHATTTPLVGRGEEIDLLLRRWEQAKGGDGCVVLVSGEPGIGKSRIAQTLLERLSGEPHTRLRYFCSPHHQDSALYPSITQLERAAGFRRDDTEEQRLAKLEAVLALATNDLSEVVPLMADLLSIPTGDRYPALNLTPQKRKEKTLHAQLAQVEGLAARQPVLMVYEDIHWSDPTTRESLDLLIERVATLRALVIITFRPEFAPSWVGRPHVTLLSLSRLPPRQRAEMITHVTTGKVLPKEIADQIVERTDGVPLFIEELTKAVIESGLLVESGDRYFTAGPIAPLAIPTSLQASLLARLDRLAPTREVAQIAAALGRQFSHELISAVAAMPQPQLDDGLAQLVHAELIFRRGTPPDAEYTFKHALVQDAAYGTLLRSRRQQIHTRIAATLEDQFSEIVVTQPALLAQHCAEAGLMEKAVAYWLKAGQRALARSAMTEAVAQLRKGLVLLSGLPDGPWRRQQELDLQIALRPALAATKGFSAADVGETIARARALAEQIDRPEYLVPLIWGQWVFHWARSEHKLALSLAEQIEKIGEARNDVAAQLLGHRANGQTRLWLGEFVAARALLEQCHGLGDPAHRAAGAGLSEDPYAVALTQLAVTLAYLGYFDQARSRLNEALSEARRLRQAQTLAAVLSGANRIGALTRSPEMQRNAEELLALSTEHGFPLYLGLATAFHGSSLTALGQAQEGLTLLTEGLAAVRATGSVANTPYLLMGLADAHAMLGQQVEGLNCLAEAARIIETTEERYHEAELPRLRGDLLNAAGDPSAAERSYHQALAVARSQSAKLLELRASISLARFWCRQGKRGEARDLLASIYNWFTEGFGTPVLEEAKALLDELG
jgi:class 3 adenylate cyclase/predicted ATPase